MVILAIATFLITATCRSEIRGTNEADRLIGTDKRDDMFGLAGDDYMAGKGGNDHMEGGRGYDDLFGQDGADFLVGRESSDRMRSAKGNDVVVSENRWADWIDCGPGNDQIDPDRRDRSINCEVQVDAPPEWSSG